ncbi:hypothetical protein QTV49_004616 [Vibrio vulnificus]|nr:hypothetical protein [Vibrio vulnificus]
MKNNSTQKDIFLTVKGIQDIQSDNTLVSPMTPEQAEYMFHLLLTETSNPDTAISVQKILQAPTKDLSETVTNIKNKAFLPVVQETALGHIFVERVIDCLLVDKLSVLAALFIMSTISNPSISSLWVYSLAKLKHDLTDGQIIDISYIAEHLFPMGLPNELGLEKLWIEQKKDYNKSLKLDKLLLPRGSSSNIVDLSVCYK